MSIRKGVFGAQKQDQIMIVNSSGLNKNTRNMKLSILPFNFRDFD